MKRHLFAAAAALTMLAGAAAGTAAEGPPGGLPQVSCHGQINAYESAVAGRTPKEVAAAFGYASVGDYERALRVCKGAIG